MRGCGLVLVLFVLAVPLPGQREVDVLITKARKAEQAGDLRQAVTHLQRAHRLLPKNKDLARVLAVLHTRVGNDCYQQKDLDGAFIHFGAADRLTPDVEGILQSLGVIHFDKGRPYEARVTMERVLKLNPENTVALMVLGTLAKSSDNIRKASEYYNRAAAADPDTRLQALADKLNKHAEVEEGFTTRTKGNFRVQYQTGKEAGVERNINLVFGHLEKARDELYKHLRQRPRGLITVVVYTDQQYMQVAVHSWARAHYDGKIRIALKPNTSMQQGMRADLRHELTHAFLFELFPKAPLWVHEGYAQLIDGHNTLIAKSKFRNGHAMLPNDVFLGQFNQSRHLPVVETGYAQSLMAVAYLHRAGTRSQFRHFLSLVGSGVGSDDALQRAYRLDVDTMLEKALKH